MRIQRLKIENFRGIKSLDWKLPTDQKLVSLIGPGDSGKSTILEAIHYLLGDRWNINFSDTDFFNVDVKESISVKAVLIDLPMSLLNESAFGLWLSGLDGDGELRQDPEDALTPCLIARFDVDETLEPKWVVERVDGQSQALTSVQRRAFSTFKVDDRTDTQLRWSRTSALGRMSAQSGGEREALAAASRAAREALNDDDNPSLLELALKVQERANTIGGGRFAGIKPGLDTSRSAMGASLALYEGVVPLTSFGLGSRRLASLAVQQLAAGSRAIAVVDELEDGLEPHRAVRLLDYLNSDDEYSQVIVTTHSPVIVEQARIESLAVVQNNDGIVSITSLGGSSTVVQRLRRSRPSSLLARRVIITEGKTEYGILLACLNVWDKERSEAGLSTSAGEGVAVQHGEGGSEVAPRSAAMVGLGYAAAAFLDNDVRSVDAAVRKAETAGVVVVRWEYGRNSEQQICSSLSAKCVSELLRLGAELRSGEDTVLADINGTDTNNLVCTLEVQDWIDDGMTLEAARDRIATAMDKRKWFKEVDAARLLGKWLMEHGSEAMLKPVVERLEQLKAFVYGDLSTEISEADGNIDG